MCTLIKGRTFKIFGTLKREFDLENKDLFRYLQLRHFYDKDLNGLSVGGYEVTEVISDAYKKSPQELFPNCMMFFLKSNGRNSLYVKLKWETELNTVFYTK